MKLFQWLTNHFAKADQATTFYKRGMVKANKHDHLGAIEAYTAALDAQDGSPELTAMILYNRGLVFVAAGKRSQGAEDLNSVLRMDAAAENVKRAATRKLARIESRTKHMA